MNHKAKLGNDGRVVVPALLRQKMGINPGDEITFYEENGKVFLGGFDKALQELRSALAQNNKHKKNLLQQLYDMRKEDAARD